MLARGLRGARIDSAEQCRLILDLGADNALPEPLLERRRGSNLQRSDCRLTEVLMEWQHDPAGHVLRIGRDEDDARVHAGGNQWPRQHHLRRVEHDPSDVFQREGECAFVLGYLDPVLLQRESCRAAYVQTTPCHVRTSRTTSVRRPSRST
jgi:hypothetical protein